MLRFITFVTLDIADSSNEPTPLRGTEIDPSVEANIQHYFHLAAFSKFFNEVNQSKGRLSTFKLMPTFIIEKNNKSTSDL